MGLYTEIYDFFNEAEGEPEKRKRRTRDEMDPPKKASKSYGLNINPEGLKSSYKPGSVHEIKFNNLTKGIRQRIYTIYRVISEQDFKDLKQNANPKVSTLVVPSPEGNHSIDVYYITIPKARFGRRTGADHTYYIYLKDDVVKGLTSEQKDKIKLVLVPIKDISDGLTKRPMDLFTFSSFLTDKEKQKLKRTKPAPTSSSDEEEPLDVDLSFLSDDEIDMGEPSDEEIPEPEAPKTTDTADQFSKEDKSAASGFVLDNDRILDKIKNNYNLSKTTSLPDAEKKKAKEELGKAVKTLIEKMFDSLKKESERDAAVEYTIKSRLEKDNKGELYKNIKNTYDIMKSLKESSFLKEEEARKKYLIKTTPGSKLDDTLVSSKVAKKNLDDKGEVARGEYIISLTDTQVRNFKSAKGLESGFKSIEDYKEEPKASKGAPVDEPSIAKADQGPMYKVGLTIDGGKEIVTDMSAGQVLKFVKSDPDNKDVSFEDIEVGVPFQFSQKLSVGPVRKGSIVLKSKTAVGQKSDRTKVLTTFKSAPEKGKQDKTVDKAEKPEMKSVKQMGRFISVPVNMGVKMASINPSDLTNKYYIVDKSNSEKYPNGRLLRDADGKPLGTDDRVEAKEIAKKMGPDYSVYQKAEMSAKKVDITEALSKEDIAKIKSNRISFTIQSDLDPDKQFNISDNVREVKEEKGKIVLVLAEAGVVTFDKEGTGIFKYSKDNKEYQALNVPSDLNSMVKKALAPAKDTKEPDSQLESYIRKRIREAIKEAEVSQYWGYQGKDVKKKRLEEYLKRYDWGFQDSENPYTHAEGSAKHAIVSKLVHELAAMGVDAIAIFNSYAPDGYQVTDLNQLDYASDSPLGSQLTQPYNPDSLTARGGRVAEQGAVATKGQGADQLDRLVANITPKLKADIIAKGNAKNAEKLISVFRQAKGIADDNKNPKDEKNVTDEMIYNKIKGI